VVRLKTEFTTWFCQVQTVEVVRRQASRYDCDLTTSHNNVTLRSAGSCSMWVCWSDVS